MESAKLIFKAYRYLYYKLYMAFLKLWGENDFPYQTAMFFIAFLIWVNMSTFFLPVLSIINGFDLLKLKIFSSSFSQLIVMLISLIFVIPPYFIFVHKKKYISIIREFKNETPKESKKGSFWVRTYIVASFSLFFILSVLARYASSNDFTLIGYFKSL